MSSIPKIGAQSAAPSKKESARSVDSTGEATASLTPELVIALCGPIGSPIHEVAAEIENALRHYHYSTVPLRLSRIIELNAADVKKPIDVSSKFKLIQSQIAAGDEVRRLFGNDILAKVAMAKIRADREVKYGVFDDSAVELEKAPPSPTASQRICHVIDSIKNKAELDLLRLIYGDAFFAIGVFSPLEKRKINLEQLGQLSPEEIAKLIDTDSGEEFSHGQSVRDTFPRCDFFLRVDEACTGSTEIAATGQIVEKLKRFFGLVFRTAVLTPSHEETAMYAAASASRNSACLSRQVGAAVTSAGGELLSIGWNDVPQSGGGLYGKPPLDRRESAPHADVRCYTMPGRKCHNDQEKSIIAKKVVDVLVEKNIIPAASRISAVDAIARDSRVKDLIEFSRAVHAEMHAILAASRVAGERVVGGRIFITTYPCHACARHVVAAGISEIHYIEPYRKSLASKLHEDSLTESVTESTKVRMFQFDGVAPRRFIDLFEADGRKEGGVLKLPAVATARPSSPVSIRAIPRLEDAVVAEVNVKGLKLLELTTEGERKNV